MTPGHFEFASACLGEHPIRNFVFLCFFTVLSYRVLRYLTAWWALGRAYARLGCVRPAAYPHKDPVFGLDVLLATLSAGRDHQLLAALARRFHDLGAHTYYTWIQGRQAIHTTEPANVQCMLATRWKDYSIAHRQAMLGKFLGRGIFVIDGEGWAQARARLRPNFARDQVADLTMLERHVVELLRVLPDGPSGVAELQPWFLRFTLDSASEFLFGHSTETLARPSARDVEFGDAFTFSLRNITEKIRRGPLNRFYRKDPREDQARQICRRYVGAFVDEATAPSHEKIGAGMLEVAGDGPEPQRYTFLKELVKAIDDKEHICDELISMMVAGRDTTASLMSNAFHVLSRRPDLWKKLRKEIQDLDSRPPSYEQLRNLKFAKYIINETLRLYPPVFQNTRRAVRDTILPTGGGPDGTSPVFVPKGSDVAYSAWTMHRREDLYGPDAQEFRPERWVSQRHGWDYVPFGGGPRICLGQQYALTEAMYVMVRMAQVYEFVETADHKPWMEQIDLTLTIKDGVKVKLTRASG